MTHLQHEKKLMRNEQIIAMVNSYGPETKQVFMAHLKTKIRLREAKLKDLNHKRSVLKSKIPMKKAQSETRRIMYTSTHAIGGFVAGATIAGFANDPGIALGSIMGGLILGAAAGVVNEYMYQDKPVTNAVNRIRNYLNNKKIVRLSEQQESDKMIADGVVSFEAHGDYEDMEAHSNY